MPKSVSAVIETKPNPMRNQNLNVEADSLGRLPSLAPWLEQKHTDREFTDFGLMDP